MAVTRAQKVRLGIFVSAGLAVLVGGLVVLAGMKLGETREIYDIRFSDADVSLSGLEVGSPVKYSGIRVGRVDRIAVDPQDVSVIVVTISLEENTPVAEDSQANLGSMGITGLKYVELTRGSRDARVRKSGETIPAGKSLLDDLSSQAGEIAEKVNVALDNVNAMTGPDMKVRVASILDRADKLLETAEATIAENREGLRTLMTRLGSTAEKVDTLSAELAEAAKQGRRLIEDGRPRLVRALDQGAALMGELRESRGKLDVALAESGGLVKELRTTVVPLEQLLSRSSMILVQSREDLVEALAYLRETAENMTVFSQKVRDDPSLLLLGESNTGDPR